ncbi:MAG: LysM peptidoglycan-binding domain-containing protein, partial [Elusimicrobiota bacterium]
LFAICCLYGAFENTSSGARPYGMGNAFSGLANDIQAVHYNPAGLTQIRHKELVAYYAKPFLGLDDKSELANAFVGYLHPLRGRESVAISMASIRLPAVYNETVTAISFAKNISKKIALGWNLKLLEIKYGNDIYTAFDPVFNNGKQKIRTAVSNDVGLLTRITKRLSVGVAAFNINEPDIGLAESVYLPIRIRAGITWRVPAIAICFDTEQYQNELKFFVGTEKPYFKDKFFIREGIGYGKDFTNISLGFSVLPDPLRIDYAFQLPLTGVKDIFGNHHLSVVFEFGKELNDPYTKDLETKISTLETEKKELQNNLDTTQQQLSNVSTEMEKTKIELEETQKHKEQLEAENRRLSYRPLPKKITYHTVEKGETLTSISEKYYGTPDRWQDIYNANKTKIERGMPVVGSQLVIP